MRIVMMGTGPFAVPTFKRLVESDHEVVGLVTRPTPPAKGRRKAPANPMRDAGTELGVAIHEPDSINSSESLELLSALGADLAVVCDYGQILSATALGKMRLGGINLHGSLLPKYRGAAPVNWALWEGDEVAGITVIHMTPKLDAGPSLVQASLEVAPTDTAIELEERLSQIGVDSVMQAIEMLATWDGESTLGVVQDPKLATKAPRLSKEQGRVQWSQSAVRIHNQIRALQPWPGTYTDWLRDSKPPMRIILDWAVPLEHTVSGRRPGEVVAIEDGRLLVATGEGVLAIERVKPAGKRAMDTAEFLRGHLLQAGDRLGDG